ncbi:Na+/H+ antiporter NhaA [Thermoflavifilum thermophilum]|uniref:Na(+)/H(+) antiporter NhaA n=1 Tax=Thermoflavifilum thermophilum TaxID=1393122 RepID=A0A1I7NB26_9BACT|nr:Na+/H+ antiporter NhaA [Thermoflavifilum thermophilum]SFV31783.1 Na+:H+ antiporter, NhaA family [Thermoflavifilum thermophilum]
MVKHLHNIFTPLRNFLEDSRSAGVLLIICTVCSLAMANLPHLGAAYVNGWTRDAFGKFFAGHLPETMVGWINDVLMSLFFFFVGAEIKREMLQGELASIRRSLLPVLAALGGMLFPALIYTLFNHDTFYHHGWGIPMATDIAFSLGVLSLLGERVPVQLKIFLMALAIIDDLGAVVTIALFYASGMHAEYLWLSGGLLVSLILCNVWRLKYAGVYFLLGAALWWSLFHSGVHPTIAGVALGFALPLSRLEQVEHILHKPVHFVILPLFALANTAVIFPHSGQEILHSTISMGVMLGLFVGKPLGIFLASYVATRLGLASLPSYTSYPQLLGAGMLGGIGFTMSIFTTSLAFHSAEVQAIAKLSILLGSLGSAIIGYLYLYGLARQTGTRPAEPAYQAIPEELAVSVA